MDHTTESRRTRVGASGYKIRVKVTTDDTQYTTRFDGADWFDQASDEDIAELHAAGYQGDPADAIAHFAHEKKNIGITRLFRYLQRMKPRKRDLTIIGFEVVVNPFDVYNHLLQTRQYLCEYLFPNGEPEFRSC